MLITFVFYRNIAVLLTNVVRLASTRYAFYINKYLQIYNGITWSNIPVTDLICKSLLILATYIFYKKTKMYTSQTEYMLKMALLGRYFVIFNANFYESLRIAYYFDYLLVMFIPNVMYTFNKESFNKFAGLMVISIPCFAYWLYFIMQIGAYRTNIYIFR